MIDFEKNYYTAPDQEEFDDLKACSIALWKTYDDTYGYATSKVSRIEGLENIGDNFMYMLAMFDSQNQMKVCSAVKPSTLKAIVDRLDPHTAYSMTSHINQ